MTGCTYLQKTSTKTLYSININKKHKKKIRKTKIQYSMYSYNFFYLIHLNMQYIKMKTFINTIKFNDICTFHKIIVN